MDGYVNYGEKHNDRTNEHKYWMVVARTSEVHVFYGRLSADSYRGMEERALKLCRQPPETKTVISKVKWKRKNDGISEAIDRVTDKETRGYRIAWNIYAGWTPSFTDEPPTTRSVPTDEDPESEETVTWYIDEPGYVNGF